MDVAFFHKSCLICMDQIWGQGLEAIREDGREDFYVCVCKGDGSPVLDECFFFFFFWNKDCVSVRPGWWRRCTICDLIEDFA